MSQVTQGMSVDGPLLVVVVVVGVMQCFEMCSILQCFVTPHAPSLPASKLQGNDADV